MSKRPVHHRHKSRKAFRRHSSPGAEPGVIRVDPEAPPTRIRVLSYGPDDLEEIEVRDVEALGAIARRRAVTWVDVDGLGDADTLARIGTLFGLHPLAMEDVVNVHQRPKVETYGDHLFIVARMPCHRGNSAAACSPDTGASPSSSCNVPSRSWLRWGNAPS